MQFGLHLLLLSRKTKTLCCLWQTRDERWVAGKIYPWLYCNAAHRQRAFYMAWWRTTYASDEFLWTCLAPTRETCTRKDYRKCATNEWNFTHTKLVQFSQRQQLSRWHIHRWNARNARPLSNIKIGTWHLATSDARSGASATLWCGLECDGSGEWFQCTASLRVLSLLQNHWLRLPAVHSYCWTHLSPSWW